MLQGIYNFPPMARVIYGLPVAQALQEELERMGSTSVYVLASGTLARQTDIIERISSVLGKRLAGVCARIGAHTPRTDVVTAANAARAAQADAVLTVGGGSVTDAAKMVGLCLGNDVHRPEQLDSFAATVTPEGQFVRPPTRPPALRIIAVPTTLSAGEFTASAACTDTVRQIKQDYGHPMMMPHTVIFDPAVTVHTPEWLFLSTGIRSVDHAVEDICSVNSQPFSDGASLHALRLLGKGLRAIKSDPSNLAARLECQLGSWMSMVGMQNGVHKGASHAIGHVLGGTAGVPHGYTSCVMLPPVLRFNEPATRDRQAWISEAFGFAGKRAGDVVHSLIKDLGLPTTLREVGVRDDQLDAIARGAMHDAWTYTNPRKIDGPQTVRALLDDAW